MRFDHSLPRKLIAEWSFGQSMERKRELSEDADSSVASIPQQAINTWSCSYRFRLDTSNGRQSYLCIFRHPQYHAVSSRNLLRKSEPMVSILPPLGGFIVKCTPGLIKITIMFFVRPFPRDSGHTADSYRRDECLCDRIDRCDERSPINVPKRFAPGRSFSDNSYPRFGGTLSFKRKSCMLKILSLAQSPLM
jgi:hypothetical protein